MSQLSPAERAELERLESRLDFLDFDIAMERRMETRALNVRLQRMGIKPLTLPPPLGPGELRSRRRASSEEPEQLVPVAKSTVVRSTALVGSVKGRMIEALIVPYGKPTQVIDSPANGGTGVPYRETWLPGAFGDQVHARDFKVYLNHEHEKGLAGVIGHAIEIHDESDGLHGSFKLHRTPDADKALELVKEQVLGGISLEAVATRSVQRGDLVERVAAKLKAVALCRWPAYEGAMVLAVRDRVR